MTPLVPIALALQLCLPSFGNAVGAEPADEQVESRPAAVALEVDDTVLLEREPADVIGRTVRYIRTDGTTLLRDQHQVEVVDEPETPSIIVELEWAVYEDSIYGVTMQTQRTGEAKRVLERFECECNDGALTAAILERIPAALKQLRQPAATTAPIPTPEPATPPNTTTPNDPSQQHRSPRPAVIGPLGAVGIVVTAGGLAMTGLGIARTTAMPTQATDPASEQRAIHRDPRPSGRVWLGVGIATTALGVAALVTDLTVLRKRRQQAISWTPAVGTGQVGLTVRGRF
ncbi:MAG: hypothetical protein K0V04_14625 [Deltaproteobacteria bacterium]|nr:hypothetical protein [Deltaproteobacteria bacterium]